MCTNFRGISLLFIAGKILAQVMLAVSKMVIPNAQCGVSKGRNLSDFVARHLHEKYGVQNRDLSPLARSVVISCGPPWLNVDALLKLVKIFNEFHAGMQTSSSGYLVSISSSCKIDDEF